MFIQLEALVGAYLDTAHPSVAATLRSEAQLRTPAEATPPCNTAALKGFLDWAIHTDPHGVSAPPKKAATPTPQKASQGTVLSSSDDEAQAVRRTSKGETETNARPAVTITNAPPSATRNGRSSHNDTTANAAEEDREEKDEEQEHTQRRVPHATQSRKRGPANLQDDGTYRRFQRIDPTKVNFHAEALRDNGPAEEHLTLRQNQEMMRVKGKSFNKLKQKNKGKFYGAGVDLTVRAYQFPDSDEE